ncbi:MAG: DUF3999 domain-containing protein [Thiotrichales bacterium]
MRATLHRLALLSICLVTGTLAAETPAQFANRFTLHPQSTADGLHRVVLPAAMYAGFARGDQRDLRVFNAGGERVPFALTDSPAPPTAAPSPRALPSFPLRAPRGTRIDDLELTWQPGAAQGALRLRAAAGNAVTHQPEQLVGWLLDARGLNQALTALNIDWPEEQSVQATLRVESSDDLVRWQALAEATPLLQLHHAGQSLAQTRIAFPARTLSYLRVSWNDAAQEPPTPRAFHAESEGEHVEAPRQWLEFNATATSDEGVYEVTGAPLAPVDRVQILAPQPNTAVAATLLVGSAQVDGHGERGWTPLLHTNVYRMTRDGVERNSPPTSIRRTTAHHWRVRVDPNSGGFGAGQPILRLGWTERTLVFAARGDGPFTLAFGAHEVESAALDVKQLLAPHAPTQVHDLPLAGLEMGPVVTPALASATDWRQPTLWGALLGAVALLGGMAWRLLREVNAPPT